MNYIDQIAKMLGVEVGEEFELIEDTIHPIRCRLNGGAKYLLEYFNKIDNKWEDATTLLYILSGEKTIKKIPWKPKEDEPYWYFDSENSLVYITTWDDRLLDLLCWKTGNCFKTEKEAKTNGKEIIEEIRKEYIEA